MDSSTHLSISEMAWRKEPKRRNTSTLKPSRTWEGVERSFYDKVFKALEIFTSRPCSGFLWGLTGTLLQFLKMPLSCGVEGLCAGSLGALEDDGDADGASSFSRDDADGVSSFSGDDAMLMKHDNVRPR